MVRFKEGAKSCRSKWSSVSIPIWFDLKGPLILRSCLLTLSFNSYMVRFKERRAIADSLAGGVFQFLYGSI